MPGIRPYVATLAVALLAACSVAPTPQGINDPYEAGNRQVHAFNKALDRNGLRPAGAAAAQLPYEMRQPVQNFADNVALPGMVANGLLQADIGGAATNTMRFLLNSTIGVFGLLDPAAAIGLEEESTDFGETLHVWGVAEGAYLELPFLGPSTARDAAGQVVDLVLDPLAIYGTPKLTRAATAATIGDLVIDRGSFGATIDSILYDSADSYAQSRLTYLQNRRFELGQAAESIQDDGGADPFALDNFDDLDLFE